MATIDLNDCTPFKAVHVGEYLKDELKAKGMKQSVLSSLTGIPAPILNDIIKGKRDITAEQSILIGQALAIDGGFFYNLQQQYDLDKARISQRVAEQSAAMRIWDVLKDYISIPFFKSVGVLSSDIKKNIKTIFEIFEVNSLDSFLEKPELAVLYKKSEKLTIDEIDLYSWKYYCLYRSKQQQIANGFDSEKVDAMRAELNAAFTRNNKLVEEVAIVCHKYGIKFLVVEKKGQVPVDGMSFKNGENPTIVLTMRRKSIDNFAFSIMHELGHIILHIDGTDRQFIQIGNARERDTYEQEADRFAQDSLISPSLWRSFKERTSNVVPHKIKPYIEEFSVTNKINPAIVMGRYQHDTNQYAIRNRFPNEVN
jgi:HTH-type transcriptional regulator / antitoxin HigA